jgi:hypothetical protein
LGELVDSLGYDLDDLQKAIHKWKNY